MLYMVTFTINIPQMVAYIPYMDPMGWGNFLVLLTGITWAITMDDNQKCTSLSMKSHIKSMQKIRKNRVLARARCDLTLPAMVGGP